MPTSKETDKGYGQHGKKSGYKSAPKKKLKEAGLPITWANIWKNDPTKNV
jgi:hypothetical protein